jgi:MFS family permease
VGIVIRMRRLLLLVCAITLVDTMLYAALVPLLPHYADEFGLSKGEAGLLVGAYATGALLGALPAGLAASRFGPRRAVVAGLLVMACASVVFGFAGDPMTLGLARLVQGAGSALSWAGALAWLVAGTPRSRRGEMLGTAIGAAIFGALLGPALGAAAEAAGERPVFFGVSGLSLVLVAWALRSPPVEGDPQPASAILVALRTPIILAALWLMVMPALLFGVLSVLVPLELGDAGWSAAAIAAVFITAAGVEMVVAPLLGRFSDRRGRLLPLRIALGASIGVVTALALADQPAVLVPLVVCASVVFGAFWGPAMALLSDGAERIGLAQGLAFGIMNAAWGGGNAIGPAVGGVLADVAGDALPFALMALVCAVTFAAVSRGRRLSGTPLARVPESP